jgi:hypothetical protein
MRLGAAAVTILIAAAPFSHASAVDDAKASAQTGVTDEERATLAQWLKNQQ